MKIKDQLITMYTLSDERKKCKVFTAEESKKLEEAKQYVEEIRKCFVVDYMLLMEGLLSALNVTTDKIHIETDEHAKINGKETDCYKVWIIDTGGSIWSNGEIEDSLHVTNVDTYNTPTWCQLRDFHMLCCGGAPYPDDTDLLTVDSDINLKKLIMNPEKQIYHGINLLDVLFDVIKKNAMKQVIDTKKAIQKQEKLYTNKEKEFKQKLSNILKEKENLKNRLTNTESILENGFNN